MNGKRVWRTGTLALVLASSCLVNSRADEADPLPSWNAGSRKQAIFDFVAKVTNENGPDFVPIADRIAVFDNDGTLWCEQPVYVQAVFVRDRLLALAPSHPEWRTTPPYQAVLEGSREALAALGEKGIVELLMATHAGMTTDAFAKIARDWIATARHPRFNRLYTECVYQPMIELLRYLRENGFKTYIVSGGGVEFMRAWTEPVYGIPPEQVVGSTIKTEYRLEGDTPVLMRLPQIDFIDDKAGKPIAIGKFIGKKPIAAIGNSDGDYEMLRYVTSGPGARLGMIVHHTDPEREYAYDRDSKIGRLARALDEAPERGWWIVDMKSDWNAVFAPESSERAAPARKP